MEDLPSCALYNYRLTVDIVFSKCVQVTTYLQLLTSKCKPKRIIVCMIYYPDEQSGGSWADTSLRLLGYNRDPDKLQLLIRKAFEMATCQIHLEGVEVVPFPLFRVLDGKNTSDYIQRVEPSSQGGRKIANALLDAIMK